MKNIFLSLLTIILLVSCFNSSNPNKQTKENIEDDLETAISKAQKSEEIEKEIFLGFTFDMSESDFTTHIINLLKEKKVYLNSQNSFQYDLIDEYGRTFYINFSPRYYKDKLYEMTYTINSSTVSNGKEYISIALAFRQSERGKNFKNFTSKDILEDNVYTSIKNNLIVSFYSSSSAIMKYSNAPIAKLVLEEKEKLNKEKAKESYSNF